MSTAQEPVEVTPDSIPGSESFIFRKVNEKELHLHVVKPKGWTKDDARACLLYFFGGGFESGTPINGIEWAKWAANIGMIGIAPDYRTKKRFNGTPEECVADGRAALQMLNQKLMLRIF